MELKRTRKSYSKEFKLKIIDLMASGVSRKDICGEFNLQNQLIGRWYKEYKSNPDISFTGNGNERLTDEQRRIKELEKALKESQLEAEILKKAIGFFAKVDK